MIDYEGMYGNEGEFVHDNQEFHEQFLDPNLMGLTIHRDESNHYNNFG